MLAVISFSLLAIVSSFLSRSWRVKAISASKGALFP